MFEVISSGKGSDSRTFVNRIVASRWADTMRKRGFTVTIVVR